MSFWVCIFFFSLLHKLILSSVNKSVVYDVANRESFEALPRWYSELDAYVSDSVVKILVGNKVDKVCTYIYIYSRLAFYDVLSPMDSIHRNSQDR